MKLLIDTHVLLWSLAEPERLDAEAQRILADPHNEVLVSIVCLWEIALKKRIGKLQAEIGLIVEGIEEQGFGRLAIEDRHLETLLGLPSRHRDPFDHLLIAQAITEEAAFVTGDRLAALYPVQVIAAE